jgi:uncharacterized protein YggT (Ycf19 family)
MKAVGYVIVLLLIVAVLVWWVTLEWTECRQVGHGVVYCLGRVLK